MGIYTFLKFLVWGLFGFIFVIYEYITNKKQKKDCDNFFKMLSKTLIYIFYNISIGVFIYVNYLFIC